jgi:hypothetical protein
VAFTRPEELFYVSVVKGKGAAAKFFGYIANSGYFDAANNIYRRGEKTPPKKYDAHKKPIHNFIQTAPEPFDYRKLVCNAPLTNTTDTPRYFGDLVHQALSAIEIPDDAEKAVDKIAVIRKLDPSTAKALRNVLINIMQTENLRKLFELPGKLLREHPISDGKGNILRPDRCVIGDGLTHIIDFKTGASDSKHQKQLETYGAVFKNMGYRNIRYHLLYTDTLICETWNN